MTRERSVVRVATWSALALSARLLVGAPAAVAADLETFLDLTNALQNAAELSNRRSFAPAAPADPQVVDFALLGVVIAGKTRLALVQLASSSGPELLPLGGSLGEYRLTDVEENQVTLEGQRGQRMILRLQIGRRSWGRDRPPGAHGPSRNSEANRLE